MKIVHATWERRNLGLSCNEVTVDDDDPVDLLRARAADYETDYTVIKVPMARVDVSFYLQQAGYTFIELITSCAREARLPELSPLQRRLVDAVGYAEMDQADTSALEQRIRDGLFRDDRVSLDPHFTQAQANNRYIGWIHDELARGAQLYKLVYQGKAAGFFNLRDHGDGVHVANLGGIYPEFQRSGFGFCLNYLEVKEGIRRGARRIVSTFSSNNRGAFAIHLAIGYVVLRQSYVFVKHGAGLKA